MNLLHLGCVLALCGAQPDGHPDRDTSPIQLNHCKLEYRQSTKLGMPTMGILQEVFVQRGDTVKAGQVLAHLPSNEETAEVELDTALAASDMAVRLAIVQHKQAAAKAGISAKLHSKNACSWEQWAYDRWAEESAALMIEQAQENRRMAQLTAQRARARLATRQLIAPHDGIVSEVLCKQGESGLLGQPCMQIDDMSALRITGKLDLRDAFRLKPGDRATVKLDAPTLAASPITDLGVVAYIDTKIDPLSQTRLVIVELPNRQCTALAGLEATLIFDLVEQPQPQAAR